jgi:hypothetical protein
MSYLSACMSGSSSVALIVRAQVLVSPVSSSASFIPSRTASRVTQYHTSKVMIKTIALHISALICICKTQASQFLAFIATPIPTQRRFQSLILLKAR